MGGFGSGRRQRYQRRTTESYLALSSSLGVEIFFSLDVPPRSPGREER